MASIAATCLGTRSRAQFHSSKQRLDAESPLSQGKQLGVSKALGLIQPGATEHSVLVVEAEQRKAK